MFIKFTYENDDGDEIGVEIPAKHEVCDRCEGHGTHLNPSIGEHAYTQEEFDEAFDDDESRENYFKRGGIYDVTCHDCGGKRVVAVPDFSANNWPKHSDPSVNMKEFYTETTDRRAMYEAEDRHTRRMEDGGYGY
jgi:hypothetical protein